MSAWCASVFFCVLRQLSWPQWVESVWPAVSSPVRGRHLQRSACWGYHACMNDHTFSLFWSVWLFFFFFFSDSWGGAAVLVIHPALVSQQKQWTFDLQSELPGLVWKHSLNVFFPFLKKKKRSYWKLIIDFIYFKYSFVNPSQSSTLYSFTFRNHSCNPLPIILLF